MAGTMAHWSAEGNATDGVEKYPASSSSVVLEDTKQSLNSFNILSLKKKKTVL